LNVNFTSLTASSIYIGDALGALISAPINDKWGRKTTFWFAASCILAGGIAQVVDTHYEAVLVFGRILIGLGMGQCTVTSLLYIGEVAPVGIRGPALMMFQFLQSCSQLIAAGIGQGTEGINSTVSYKIPMGGLVVLPLMFFAGLPFIPESPVWYVSKDRQADAAHSLERIYKGHPNYNPSRDLAILYESRERELEHKEGSSWMALIRDPIERRKVIFSAGAMYAQQICGILFFYVYGVVFAQAIGIKQPFTIQLITNIFQIFAVAAAVLTGNRVRRRVNLLITTGMMFIAFLIIGGIGTRKNLTTASQYVIVVFSFVIIVAFNYGLGPLAYTVARKMAVGQIRTRSCHSRSSSSTSLPGRSPSQLPTCTTRQAGALCLAFSTPVRHLRRLLGCGSVSAKPQDDRSWNFRSSSRKRFRCANGERTFFLRQKS
jgi:MFS family permease